MSPSVPVLKLSGRPGEAYYRNSNSSSSSTPPLLQEIYVTGSMADTSPIQPFIPGNYGFIKEAARSEESIPTSLTNKMGNFYLQTPTVVATPTFSQAPILHTPVSMGTSTPAVAHARISPGTGNYSPPRGSYPGGLHLSFVEQAPLTKQPVGLLPAQDEEGALSMEYYVSFKMESMEEVKEQDSQNLTIEDLLKEDPFSSFTADDPGIMKFEDDELLSSFLEFEEQGEVPKKHRASKSSPPPSKISKHKPPAFTTLQLQQSTPKLLRKSKSFTSVIMKNQPPAGPAFSLEECSNEFHVTEGNYSFQDETARLSMQLGPALQTPKKKLSQKFPKTIARPTLRKSKTTSNLCLLQISYRSAPKVLKNMESGLVSFQLQLNGPSQ